MLGNCFKHTVEKASESRLKTHFSRISNPPSVNFHLMLVPHVCFEIHRRFLFLSSVFADEPGAEVVTGRGRRVAFFPFLNVALHYARRVFFVLEKVFVEVVFNVSRKIALHQLLPGAIVLLFQSLDSHFCLSILSELF